jgi:hypothetical protein
VDSCEKLPPWGALAILRLHRYLIVTIDVIDRRAGRQRQAGQGTRLAGGVGVFQVVPEGISGAVRKKELGQTRNAADINRVVLQSRMASAADGRLYFVKELPGGRARASARCGRRGQHDPLHPLAVVLMPRILEADVICACELTVGDFPDP